MHDIVFNLQRFADDGTLTDAEKEEALKSSLPHLRMISNIAKVPLFSAFVSMLEKKKTETEFLSSTVAPVYNLIGALYKRQYGKNGALKLMEEAAIFTSTVKIIDSILDIYDNLAGADAEALEDNILKIADESVKLGNKLKLENYSGIFSSVGSAALSYGLTVLASIDNLTPKAQTKIYKAFVKVGGATIKSVFKEVFETGEKFTAPFGLVDMGMSVLIGIVEGVSQMGIRQEYYSDDGLPEDIAHKEALLDALSSGVHEALHTYLKGADDIAFKVGQAFGEGCKWLAHAFSGDFSYEITISDMNYMEFVREIAKRGEYNSSSNADTINVPDSGVSIYAQDGDDYIENFYNNVTILAGHGNDTVSSYGGAKYNSILGGNDSDYLYIKNSSSTIEGGKDKDRFFITGDKNIIYGNDGDDQVSIKGSGNFFSGGAGDDLIILDGAKNVIIEYTAGDGTDAIYGYDTSDVIKIKGEYSTQISGNDVIIQVGKGGLIVKDAKDLKLNLNTIEADENETLDNDTQGGFTPFSSGIVFAPSFQDNGEALRGTNTNDRIENTLSNIMIYSGDGNDTIINYGNNVTINAGNGNDHVLNYGASVKVNGGDGDDYIYNEGSKTTINGGAGKDTVKNTGNNSLIDGGADMDSINNSGEGTDINSGGGKDSIVNEASNVRAYGYLDENYISNTKSNVTLEGSEDNDYIFNSGNSVSINAGAGNNSVSIDG
ncbi:MAG: calcium-binding protein, partial [Selenomonadaceae bacterium]|nr:calcium-binding protein [Selenomonadaceae bacterium]